jgi:hypothetical protein
MNIIPPSIQPPPPPPRRRGKSLTKSQDIKEEVKEVKDVKEVKEEVKEEVNEQTHLPLVRKDCTIYIEFYKK